MKRKMVKKHSSKTVFIRRSNDDETDPRTIKERHENTKEKLNKLLNKKSITTNNQSASNQVDITDTSGTNIVKVNTLIANISQTKANHGENLLVPSSSVVNK